MRLLEARAANTRFFAITRRRELNGQICRRHAGFDRARIFHRVFIRSCRPREALRCFAPTAQSLSAIRQSRGPVAASSQHTLGGHQTATADRVCHRYSRDRRLHSAYLPTSDWQRYRASLRSCGSVERDAVIRAWASGMAGHLIFGLPAAGWEPASWLRPLRASDESNAESTERRCARRRRWKPSGQLTGGIAHDFNNMLTVILGNRVPSRRLGAGKTARPQACRRRAPGGRAAPPDPATARLLAPAAALVQGRREQTPGAEHVGTFCAGPSASTSSIETVMRGGILESRRSIRTSSKARCSTWPSTPATPCPTAAS